MKRSNCPKCKTIGSIRYSTKIFEDHIEVVIYKCLLASCGHQVREINNI